MQSCSKNPFFLTSIINSFELMYKNITFKLLEISFPNSFNILTDFPLIK